MSQLLISIEPFEYVLEEGENKKLKIKGIFQKADVINGNNRVYPLRILEREINKIQPLIKERRLLGELSHPNSEDINLERVSHLITHVELKNKDVIGEAEVLSGTPYGGILETLLKNNIKLGISSRGKGTVTYRNGVDEVNEDFNLITWDIVYKPSTPGAFPQPIYEHQEKENKKLISIKSLIDKVLTNEISEKELVNLLKGNYKNKKYII